VTFQHFHHYVPTFEDKLPNYQLFCVIIILKKKKDENENENKKKTESLLALDLQQGYKRKLK